MAMDTKNSDTPAGGLIYEDVEPQYQWMPGTDTDNLIVNLTGFKGEEFRKEHLRVKIDSHGNLKVSGESPIGGGNNRWRRFQKVFRMADDCNTTEIKAKFDRGVLYVTMPKLTKEQPRSPPHPQPVDAAQVPSVAPAAPAPAPPAKAPDEGKAPGAAPADKKEEEPVPPRVQRPPKMRRARRRPTWVAAAAVAVVVALAVAVGVYYWSCRVTVIPDEQQLLPPLMEEGFEDY